jgi:hypothetical protein
MADSAGPFDYHLVRRLIALCVDHDIPFQRDIFCDYRSDSASAVEAGNDIRTALLTFGVDSSHGYERTHLSSLDAIAKLLAVYMQNEPVFWRDRNTLGSDNDFPTQPFDEFISPNANKGMVEHLQEHQHDPSP